MALNVVVNVGGRARVSWAGAAVLFLGLLAACVAVPAAGFWLALADAKLAGTAAAAGFSIACGSFALLLAQQLRLQLGRLPERAESGSETDSA